MISRCICVSEEGSGRLAAEAGARWAVGEDAHAPAPIPVVASTMTRAIPSFVTRAGEYLRSLPAAGSRKMRRTTGPSRGQSCRHLHLVLRSALQVGKRYRRAAHQIARD